MQKQMLLEAVEVIPVEKLVPFSVNSDAETTGAASGAPAIRASEYAK